VEFERRTPHSPEFLMYIEIALKIMVFNIYKGNRSKMEE